jgi:hypothetical protein
MDMDNVTYGLTMTILGMGGTIVSLWIISLAMNLLGGTIVSLWIISLAMNLLKRLFPYEPEQNEKTGEGNVGSN